MSERFYTKAKAAIQLGISPTHLAYRIEKGYYPAPTHTVGDAKKLFYSAADLKVLRERTEMISTS